MNAFSKDAGNWTVWFDENLQDVDPNKENVRKDSSSQHDFLERMAKAGSCDSYETFRNIWRQLCDGCGEPPVNTNIRLFRDGLKPLWEDSANVDGGKFVICVGSKDGGAEKFLAIVSALMANELSDSAQLTGAVLSSRTWGHTLSLWHSSAQPGDRAAHALESELRALVDEASISFHQHRKSISYHAASRSGGALDASSIMRSHEDAAAALTKGAGPQGPRVAPRMSLRQRKSGMAPYVKSSSLGNEMARLEARWSTQDAPPKPSSGGASELMQMLSPSHWSVAEISAALGAAVIAFALAVAY